MCERAQRLAGARLGMKRGGAVFALAIAIPLAAVWIWVCVGHARAAREYDFVSFYTGGLLASQGRFEQLYDPGAQLAVRRGVVPGNSPFVPWVRPPLYALLLAPLGMLGFQTAFTAWTLVYGLILLACWLWSWRRFGADALVYSAFFYPAVISIGNGQDGALMLALTLAGFLLAERERDLEAGAVLALGLVKFHLWLLWLPAMLLVRRKRMAAGYAASAAVQATAAIALAGFDGLGQYAKLLGGGDMEAIPPAPELMVNAGAISVNFAFGNVAVTAGITVLALALWFAAVSGGAPLWRWFAATATASLIVAPCAYNYDLTLLLVPALCGVFLSGRKLTRALAALTLFPFLIFLTYVGRPWTVLPALGLLAFLAALAAERLHLPVDTIQVKCCESS